MVGIGLWISVSPPKSGYYWVGAGPRLSCPTPLPPVMDGILFCHVQANFGADSSRNAAAEAVTVAVVV